MSRILSCLTILAVGLGLTAQAADERVARAEAVVDALAKAEFGSAVSFFDGTMKEALPPPKLRETWNALLGQGGSFKERIGARVGEQQGYGIVVVTCRLERSFIDVRVVMNAKAEVAGLFFAPAKRPGSGSSASQEPPAGIRETEVIVGEEGWPLPATLTRPVDQSNRPWPAVVLVHGSGPADRDETVGANKPFRDLAWGLARRGVAVLRYEKRTKAHAERLGGIAGFTVQDEVIADALSAVRLLRSRPDIDPNRITVLGHSMGGTLAPRIAQADAQLAGIVILAGATRRLEDAMIDQTRYLLSLDGSLSTEDEARIAVLQTEAARIKALQASDAVGGRAILGAPPSYWLDLQHYDPVATAKALGLRTLIVQGGRDYQVTVREFETWRTGLQSRANVTFKLYPRLNHLFIAGEGPSTPGEYDVPSHVDEAVIEDIARWILGMAPPLK